MDPLSDILSLLKPRSYACGGIDAGGKVSIHFPRHEGIKCYAVVSGEGWLLVEGTTDPVHLRAGDCFVLPRGLPFRLATDLALPATDYRDVLAGRSTGMVASVNGGGGCMIVGGYFAVDGRHADLLLGVLPPVVHIRSDADRAALRWCLEQMVAEMRAPQPGSALVVEHLAQMMLVQALRLHLADKESGRVGWLFALADRQIGGAIAAMHADPAQCWTLGTLARQVGLSRTSFALRFKATVGTSAMDYLTRWRMMLAAERLTTSREPVSAIGLALGYESESAFSTAFKRTVGCSPRQYARAQRSFPSGVDERQTLEGRDIAA